MQKERFFHSAELFITVEKQDTVTEFSLQEAVSQGISCALTPTDSRDKDYKTFLFSFDGGEEKWHLQSVRWVFSAVSLPGGKELLYLPDKGGARWPEPYKLLFEEQIITEGCWRDRKFWLRESGLLTPDKKGAEENSVDIRSSMPFFSYVSPERTLSAFMLDKGFETTFIKVSAKKGVPAIDIELRKEFNRDLCRWECPFVLGSHTGDWHQDARCYKKFYDSLRIGIRKYVPLTAGVHAHYDLRWQDGTVHNRYADLPRLADQAIADGFDAIVFGGWNEGGFDNNYPHFRPDPLLGSEKELIAAVEAIHAKGIKALFYVNGFSYDRSRPDFDTVGAPCAMRFADGSTRDVRWGSKVLSGMCTGSAKWRQIVNDNVRYVCEVLKADGLYLDQFNVIPPRCYAQGHDHSRSVAAGIFEAFREIRKTAGEDKVFITEHPLDSLNASVDYQDLETVWNNQALTYPELFCYTFPEAGRMDLLIQKPWPCTDPEVEGRHLRKNHDRLFLTGTALWCYGHAPRTKGFEKHFQLGQKLRKEYADFFRQGIYRHTDHIASTPAGVTAAWYDLPDNKAMVLVANTTSQPGHIVLDSGKELHFSSEALQVILISAEK